MSPYPYHGEPTPSARVERVLAVLAGIALIVLVLILAGCASWSDYAADVRTVNATIAADKKAAAERETKEESAFYNMLASPNLSKEERIAMMGFYQLGKAKGGGVKEGPGYLVPQPPPDPVDSVVKLAGVVVPTAANVAIGLRQARVQERSSDNAARVAESTNAAMVALGNAGARESGETAREALRQVPNFRPSVTFTIGRDGVIGDGSFAPVTQSLSTGGDGVLGAGTITRPANPTRVCTVGTTGILSCSPS